MTKQPKRIQVKETKEYYGGFEGSLESIITSLQNQLDKGWEGITNQRDPYEDYSSPYLYKHREETKDEYQKRIQGDKVREGNEKKRRMQQYEQLKREFGDA